MSRCDIMTPNASKDMLVEFFELGMSCSQVSLSLLFIFLNSMPGMPNVYIYPY
jgi:hypothetical protein